MAVLIVHMGMKRKLETMSLKAGRMYMRNQTVSCTMYSALGYILVVQG
jgi:hypothetical protein